MRNIKVIILTVIIQHILLGQSAPYTLWTKTFGGVDDDWGYSIEQTDDGGFIVVGTTYSFGFGFSDVYLIKTDSNGNVAWTKTFGGSEWEQGNSVQQTNDGGYIIAGSTTSFGPGSWSAYLIRTDSVGDTLWTKAYQHNYDCQAASVRQTEDGGFVVVGSEFWTSPGSGGSQDYIVKTDLNGDTLWTRYYTGGEPGELFTYTYASAQGVCETSDNGYFIVGGYEDKAYLLKLSVNGDSLWTTYFDNSFGTSIQPTLDGKYIICGGIDSGGGNYDVLLMKIDTNGDTLWAKSIGTPDYEIGYSVSQTDDGGFIITGITGIYPLFDVYVIKTNTDGDTLWTKTIGGVNDESGNAIRQTADGGYIIVGSTASFGAGGSDFWLIKLGMELTIADNISFNAQRFRLYNNYPNPFNLTTTISYQLPKAAFVNLSVYNITGQRVETLVNGRKNAGFYSLRWDASGVGSGLYFYRIEAGEYVETKKCLILK
jgi:hypothetical protein